MHQRLSGIPYIGLMAYIEAFQVAREVYGEG